MLLSDANAPGITQVYGAYENESHISLIMEYIDGIPLNEWIHYNKVVG
jgi:serine/threonine protein kinase